MFNRNPVPFKVIPYIFAAALSLSTITGVIV